MQGSEAKKLEPIYSTLFNVEFTSVDLTEEDKEILNSCVASTADRKVTFKLYYDEATQKIIPIESILKLRDGKRSDVIISMLNKEGKIIGNLIYRECNVDVDFSTLFSFSYLGENPFGIDFSTGKELSIGLFPTAILYNNQEI